MGGNCTAATYYFSNVASLEDFSRHALLQRWCCTSQEAGGINPGVDSAGWMFRGGYLEDYPS